MKTPSIPALLLLRLLLLLRSGGGGGRCRDLLELRLQRALLFPCRLLALRVRADV